MTRKKAQIPQISPEEQRRQELLNAARMPVEMNIGAIVAEWRQNFEQDKKKFAEEIEKAPRHAVEFYAGRIVRLQTVVDLVGEVEHRMSFGKSIVQALHETIEEVVKKELLYNRFRPNSSDMIHNAINLCKAEGYSAFYEAMRTHVEFGNRRTLAVMELRAMGLTPEEIQSSIPTEAKATIDG